MDLLYFSPAIFCYFTNSEGKKRFTECTSIKMLNFSSTFDTREDYIYEKTLAHNDTIQGEKEQCTQVDNDVQQRYNIIQ